jgi:phosphoribosylformimino-5-aminoimidazole carboxamide ribotide isomerase
MTEKFPSRIVLGIDARDSMVATEGWLDVSQTSALELARQYAKLPIAAIIYTNIANDGMMQGVDAGTLHDLGALADLGRPVIASGGVTTVDDIVRLKNVAAHHPHLAGAIIGRSLYENKITVKDAVAASQ